MEDHDAKAPSRRTIAKGAAWAAPALVVASSAPAFAASGNIQVTYVSQCTAGRTTAKVTFSVTVIGDLTIPSGSTISLTANPGRALLSFEIYGGSLQDYLDSGSGDLLGNGSTKTFRTVAAVPAGTYTFSAQFDPPLLEDHSVLTFTVPAVAGETSTADNSATTPKINRVDSSRPRC